MRSVTAIVVLLFLGLWGFSLAVFSGSTLTESFNQFFPTLKLPDSTATLGDSLGVFDGLLSSVAVLLALLAVVLQGRALQQQNLQHERALKVSAISTKLQFLNAEVVRLGVQADSLEIQIERLQDGEKKTDLFKILRNSRNKQIRLREESEQANDQLTALLERIGS
jgi:hypothetical protein